MPTQGSLTNAGAAGLMTSGAPLAGYLQIGNDTLPQADWQTATAVPGAFRALPISRAIVATQTTLQALDDVDAQAYDDLASIGFWNMDPSMSGAELWWLGTAAAGEVLSAKTLNNDLIWTAALILTPAQVANLSFDVSIETVSEASETRFGITRYATDTEAGATEANASDERTPTMAKLWTWWNGAVSKLLLRTKLGMATSQQARAGTGDGVMTAELTATAISELVPEASETRFGITRYATDTEAGATEANASDERTPTMAKLWTWWNGAVSKLLLRTKLGMATSQQARAGTGDGVMTAELTATAISELVPEASETRFGITRYATDTEAGATEANASDERTPTMAKLWTWWTNLVVDAGKITSGVFDVARIPASIARLASPKLTGQPTAPTPPTANNSTRVATTAHVYAVRDAMVNGAPGALDTLDELAAALGDDANFRTTILNLIAERGTRTGAIVAYGGAAAPSGYLLCDGQAVSRVTYPALFASIGEVWGVGDGATTFNLPDLQGRVLAGAGVGLGAGLDSVGETGGSATHTLITSEIPAHSHTFEGQHGGTRSNGVEPALGNENNTETVTTTEVGGGQAHNNVQPTAIVNWVIKT